MKAARVRDRAELQKLATHLEKNLEKDETLIWKNDFVFHVMKSGKISRIYMDRNYTDDKK